MPDVNVLPDPQPGDSRENFDRDLRPDPLAGSNFGTEGPMPEKDAIVAADIKEFHRRFPELSGEDLKQLAVMPPGAQLAEGATYIDMQDPARQPFTASGGMTVSADNWFVPKSETDYQLWNRLVGVQDPERTGEADDS